VKACLKSDLIHGGLQSEARQLAVKRFIEGGNKFMVSTSAGGCGINPSPSLVINKGPVTSISSWCNNTIAVLVGRRRVGVVFNFMITTTTPRLFSSC
jgi:hypothetical protein